MTADREDFSQPESTRQPSQTQARSHTGRRVLGDRNRIAMLQRLNLLNSDPEPTFDRLVRLAHLVLEAPVSLISMVDDSHQYFKAAIGLDGAAAETRRTPLSHSFCQHVVVSGRPLIVEDARIDPLVRGNLAVEDLSIIAYLGVPVLSPDGLVLGSFCVIDSKPRRWKAHEIDLLKEFSQIVTHELASHLDRIAMQGHQQAGHEHPQPRPGREQFAQASGGLEPASHVPVPADAPPPPPAPAAGKAAPGADSACVLDPHVLDECRNLPGRHGGSILFEIADLYLKLEQERMRLLEEARTQRDFRALAAHAHTLAGSCANLGATDARTLLLNLEAAAKTEDEHAVSALIIQVKAALERVRTAVIALREAEAKTATTNAP